MAPKIESCVPFSILFLWEASKLTKTCKRFAWGSSGLSSWVGI